MKLRLGVFISIFFVGLVCFLYSTSSVDASHSWESYHWARTSNPFNLKLGDNLLSIWDPYLGTTSSDWTLSSVLNTTIVSGSTRPRTCKPTSGRVEICNATYGNNGWLGVAQIWVSGSHITKGTTKVNDTYFNTPIYNTPAWRNLVMCQEVGHALGLDHQDENFDNPPLGTCMDYTNGPTPNQHPNSHDYDQLALIYEHLDSSTTVGQALIGQARAEAASGMDLDKPTEWGRKIRDNRSAALYERDFGGGNKIFTFVIWAN